MAAHKNRTFDRELQLMAKRANQRMVELERLGDKSPAYQHIQAVLTAEGRNKGANRGRRFSETGKGTRYQIEHQKALLRRFLNQQTSTIRGAKKYRSDVEKSIEKNYHISEAGISFDDFVDAIEKITDSESTKIYGSDIEVKIIVAYQSKKKKVKNEQKLSTDDIIKVLEKSGDLKTALTSLGLTMKDIEAKDLGAL